MGLRQRFTQHPASVDETYLEHFGVASHFAKELFGAAAACAVHAVLPWRHQSTASTRVRALYNEMNAGKRGELATLALVGDEQSVVGRPEERQVELPL